VKTQPNSIPALDVVMVGLLGTSRSSDIDIFKGLQKYLVQDFRHGSVTDISEYVVALKKKLFCGQEDHEAQCTKEQQKHHIAGTNTYLRLLSGLLAHNGAQVQFSANRGDGVDITKQLASCFRQEWQRNYQLARQQHAEVFEAFRTRISTAGRSHDQKGIVAARRAKRKLNDRLFHCFVDRYLNDLAAPTREQENRSYDELEDLYEFYTAGRTLGWTTLHTTYELIEKFQKVHTETADDLIAQLEALDNQVQACDNMFSIIAKDWRKTVTRLHRLTAVDIRDPEKREVEIARRFEHRGAFPLMLQMRIDVAQTTTNFGGINDGLNQIQKGLKELDIKVLDLYVAGETAMLASLVAEKKGEDKDICPQE
jgi:hypothetical protein